MSTHLKIAKTLAVLFTSTLITTALMGVLPAGAASPGYTGGVSGATGCTGPYRGCTYQGGTSPTSGPACIYNLTTSNNNITGFSIRCTDLSDYGTTSGGTAAHMITFTICPSLGAGNQGTCPTTASLYSIQVNLDNAAGQPYNLGGPTSEYYLNTADAISCAPNQTYSACIAANPNIASWLTNDQGYCGGSTPPPTTYWLWPPGLSGQGNACVPSPIGTSSGNWTQEQSVAPDYATAPTTGNGQFPNMVETTTPIGASIGCQIQQWYGPNTMNGPQTYTWTYLMSAGTQRLLATPTQNPNFYTIPSSFKVWTDVDGHTYQGFQSQPTSSGTGKITVDYSQASVIAVTNLWCESGGTWQLLGNILGLNTVLHNLLPAGVDCYAQIHLGWNPGSWIVGAFQGLGCVMTALFVTGVSNASSNLLTTVDSKAPISYLTDAVNASTTIITAISTATNTGTCSPPTFAPFSQSTGYLASLNYFKISFPMPANICTTTIPSDASAGELFGYRSYLWDLEAFGIWLATVAVLWRFLPWSRRGDGIQILEQFGGLSDHVMDNGVEVYQTNEGSD